MKRINEIFHSLQGEGYNTGTAAVFVRFSGCNLQCNFCDTQHNEGTVMTEREIVNEIMQYPLAPLVVLTGGEPSLFIDHDFVAMLKHLTGKRIAIETNGTNMLPDNLDWVTLSPKGAYPGGEAFPLVIDNCDELKVVPSCDARPTLATLATDTPTTGHTVRLWHTATFLNIF